MSWDIVPFQTSSLAVAIDTTVNGHRIALMPKENEVSKLRGCDVK